MSYINEILEKVKRKKFGKWSFFESSCFILFGSFMNGLTIPIILIISMASGLIDENNIILQSITGTALYFTSMMVMFKLYNDDRKTHKYLLSEKEIDNYLENLEQEQRKFAINELARAASDNKGDISLALLIDVDEKLEKYSNTLNKVNIEECIRNKYNNKLILNSSLKKQSETIKT